jgi:hypothetical protein
MNLLALKGEVSCKRYIIYEVRSARKFIECGACVADPTANKEGVPEIQKQLFSGGRPGRIGGL